jgi:Ca2+-binding RTX toxin-like protein
MAGPRGSLTYNGTAGSDTLDFGWLADKGYSLDYVTLGGNDSITGTIYGDTFTLGKDKEIIDGDAGWDTVIYSNSTSGVIVDLTTTTQHGGFAEGDQLYHIENVTGSKYGDFLGGTGGANTIDGQGGDDFIWGGAGSDRLDGGDGIDTLSYLNSSAGVKIDLGANQASGGDATGDTIKNFENAVGSSFVDVLYGSNGDNKLFGGDLGDTLYGNDGNDLLVGDGGDDKLYGGANDDTMRGGAGGDYFDGGSGTNTVDYRFAPMATDSPFSAITGVYVDLSAGRGYLSDAAGDTYVSVQNVHGSQFNDVLVGDSHDNALYGYDLDDIISGGAGADYLDGGSGRDTVDYSTSATGVSVNLATNQVGGGDADGDTILRFESVAGSNYDDQLFGSDDNNGLFGRGGNDILVSGAGFDQIQGDAGNDIMAGGSEADTFVFYAHNDHDIITDFTVGVDHLQFLDRSGPAGFHFVQSGGSTIITYDDDPGSSITLMGVNTLQLLAHLQTDLLFA